MSGPLATPGARRQRVRRFASTPRGITWIAASAALIVFAAGLVAVLSPIELLRTATNERSVTAAVTLAPGGSACQAGEVVPRGSGRVTMPVATSGGTGGPLLLTVLDASGRDVTSAHAPAGFHDGFLFLRLAAAPTRDVVNARVCVRDEGARPILLRGQPALPARNAAAGPGLASAPRVSMRLDWFRAGSHRRLALAPAIAPRFAYAKASILGAWTLWAVAVALAAISLAAIWWACSGRAE